MATPTATTQLNTAAPTPGRWLGLGTSVALGVAWWILLLLPEASRPFLLDVSALEMVWAFVRVVGIVTVACTFFRYAYRRRPMLSPLTALACLWGGSIAFLLMDAAHPASPDDLGIILVAAPFLFVAFAWFVALPMTVLTAVALARLERQQSTAPF